jgi:hypothetical protein
MPGSVIAAVAGSVVSSAVTSYIGTTLVGQVVGALAGGIASSVVGSAFADKPDAPDLPESASFEAQLRDNLVTVRQPITHWQWIHGRVRVGGALTFAHESADENLHLIITLAGHACHEIEAVQFNDELVPLDGSGNATGKYAGYVRILKSLGDESGQPFPALVAESEGKWTDAHRQSGRAKLYVRLTFSADLFPTGIPNITAVVKGKADIYDPRTATRVYTDNPSLCMADLLCAPVWLAADYATEIDDAQLIAAANIDDETVSLAAGGTEARYTLNGAFAVNADTRSVLNKMLSANGGRCYYIGGVFRFHPAAYATPTVTLDEDDLRSVPQVSPRLSASDLCNRVKGVYVAEGNLWQPSDFPPVTNATYLAEDNDEPSWRELDLPFTKSTATGQRIAKVELERVRQQISVQWPGKLTAYALQPGDTVKISFSMLGWSEKVFEVVGAALAVEDDDDGGARLGCDLSLRETASSVFDWSSGEETTVDAAPDTNLPDPFSVPAPGAPTVSDVIYETTGARRVQAKMVLACSAAGAQVRDYEFQYKLAAESVWTVLPRTTDTAAEVLDIAPGTYNVRVKAVSQIGVSSAWSPTTTKEILGLAARPGTPAGVTLQKVASRAHIRLDAAADLDVLRGGRVLVRHAEATTGATWEGSFSIGDERGYAGDATQLDLPLKSGTYLLKFEDSSGQQSETAASVVSDGATVLAYSTLDSVIEDSTFPGAHSSTVAVDGVLKLSGAGLMDDIPDFDAISSLDDYGGVATTGTYTFSAGIDLGSKKRVRVVSEIEGLTVNVNDLFDDRLGSIDDWLDFDGTAGGGSADAWTESRTSDDAITWSAWHRLDVAEQYARYLEFRLQMRTTDPAYNLQVSRLRCHAEEIA